jgi:hypothetical protein
VGLDVTKCGAGLESDEVLARDDFSLLLREIRGRGGDDDWEQGSKEESETTEVSHCEDFEDESRDRLQQIIVGGEQNRMVNLDMTMTIYSDTSINAPQVAVVL